MVENKPQNPTANTPAPTSSAIKATNAPSPAPKAASKPVSAPAKTTSTAPEFISLEPGVLLYPITTEKAIGMIELENKLLFVVEKNATKPQIKEEIERLFKVKVGAVNTKITPKGIKHAYIRLKTGKADDIASQLKIV